MRKPEQRWTAEQVRALPDDGCRHEVIDGVLIVTPAPSRPHQAIVGDLYVQLHLYLREHRVGLVFLSPADIVLDDETLVQPDIFVVPPGEGGDDEAWSAIKRLTLAIEVLSPGTARIDRGSKRRRYQLYGIPEYWIIDRDARLVERWRPTDERPEILVDTLLWQPDGAAPPLLIDLPALFGEAAGAA